MNEVLLRSVGRFTAYTLLTAVLLAVTTIIAIGDSSAYGTDLIQDYISARAWLMGDDPYSHLHQLKDRYDIEVHPKTGEPVELNPHPPLSVLLVAPIAWLDYNSALLAYQALQILAMALAWNAVCAWKGVLGWPTALIGGLFGMWKPFWEGIDWGQPNGMLALWGVGLAIAIDQRRGLTSGVLFGIACCHRPFFLPMAAIGVVYPARTLIRAILGAGLATGVIFAVVGITPWGWLNTATSVDYFIEMCGSIPGVLHMSAWMGAACLVLFSLALAWAISTGRLMPEASYTVGLTGAMLFYPLAWYHYDTILIPVLLVVVLQAHQRDSRWGLIGMLLYLALRAIENINAWGSPEQLWLQVIARSILFSAVIWLARPPKSACTPTFDESHAVDVAGTVREKVAVTLRRDGPQIHFTTDERR